VTEESDDVLRALADPERLAIAGMLAREPRTAASLREAGLPLGAASEDEEAVLRTFFRNGTSDRDPREGVEAADRAGTRGDRVRAGRGTTRRKST
jgi:DNA-binding transcriptional ArsR family regulator